MRQKRTFFKTVAMGLAMALLLLVIPEEMQAGSRRQGAWIIVEQADGQYIEGELLRIDDLKIQLIVDSLESRTIPIDGIKRVMVKKKPKFLTGVAIGLAASFLAGGILGSSLENEGMGLLAGLLVYGPIFALPTCTVCGGLFALGSSGYRVYQLNGNNPQALKTFIENLSPQSLEKKTNRPACRKFLGWKHSPFAKPLGKFHFSYSYGAFHSRSGNEFNQILDNARLSSPILIYCPDGSTVKETISSLGDAFSYGNNQLRLQSKNFQIDYSINSRIALGLSLSRLRGMDQTMTWTIPSNFYYFYSNSFHVSIQGNAYYLTAAYMPLKNTRFTRSSLKVGLGMGMSRLNFDFNEFDSAGVTATVRVSKTSPAFKVFGEWSGYVTRNLSLGLGMDYHWIPTRSPALRIYNETTGFCYNETKNLNYWMEIPQSHFNFRAIGYHTQIAVHF